jgi:hypothetical protein
MVNLAGAIARKLVAYIGRHITPNFSNHLRIGTLIDLRRGVRFGFLVGKPQELLLDRQP